MPKRRITKSYYRYFCLNLIEDMDKMVSSLISKNASWMKHEDKMDIRSLSNFELLKAMKTFDNKKADNDYFKKYLYVFIKTMIHNFRRKSKRGSMMGSEILLKNHRDRKVNPDIKIDIQHIVSILMKDIKLSDLKKDVLYECVINQLSPSDISFKTGIPIKKVYNIRQKVMAKLQGVAISHGYNK